jgi:hypothetical protein
LTKSSGLLITEEADTGRIAQGRCINIGLYPDIFTYIKTIGLVVNYDDMSF